MHTAKGALLILAALWLSPALAQGITYDVGFSIGGTSFTGSITAAGQPCNSCGPIAWTFMGSDGGVISSAAGGTVTNAFNQPLAYTPTSVYFEPDLNAGSIEFTNSNGSSLTFTGGKGSPPDSINYISDTNPPLPNGTDPPFGAGQSFFGVPDGQPALTLATAAAGPTPVPMHESAPILVLAVLLLLWRWQHLRGIA